MSYYALFKGWLLLSKPPGCFSTLTSFTTKRLFWGLSWWSGLFPFWLSSLSPTVPLVTGRQCLVFSVCHDLVPLSQPAPKQCFTPRQPIHNRCASTHFEENQLAPSSIGISPLATAHPTIFQHRRVRTSTWYYPSFILAMARSPGFGSMKSDSFDLHPPCNILLPLFFTSSLYIANRCKKCMWCTCNIGCIEDANRCYMSPSKMEEGVTWQMDTQIAL